MPNYAMVLSDSLYALYHGFRHGQGSECHQTEQLLNLLQVPVLTNVNQLKRLDIDNKALVSQLTSAGKIGQTLEELSEQTFFKIILSEDKVEAPNQVWVSDITYLWSGEGWSYMAKIIDLFNREVVGMAIKDRMDRSLIIEALKAAVWSKKPAAGLIFHSDRGSQYCSDEFRSLLAFYSMKSSMSRKGNCWDNAVAESFFASLKKERTLRTYRTRQELYSDVFEYVNMFYNCNRGHSYLAYKAPIEFASVNKARMAA